MTTEKQRQANRRNATRSTGPRTAQGRSVSRRNAIRHGLAASIRYDPELKIAQDELAMAMCEAVGLQSITTEAYEAAEASLDLLRIRGVRAKLYDLFVLSGCDLRTDLCEQLAKLERYERRAFSRRKRALNELHQHSLDNFLVNAPKNRDEAPT